MSIAKVCVCVWFRCWLFFVYSSFVCIVHSFQFISCIEFFLLVFSSSFFVNVNTLRTCCCCSCISVFISFFFLCICIFYSLGCSKSHTALKQKYSKDTVNEARWKLHSNSLLAYTKLNTWSGLTSLHYELKRKNCKNN